jgi:outer membrane receptor for ferrienterochelin and colicins
MQRSLSSCCLLLFAALTASAQNDTLNKPEKLEEVIVTGQYNPQSVNRSVFQVNVITRSDIDRQAGNNLADLLNQTLNISVMPNASTGKSGVKLFGLDAQYFKILVDNVPLVNDENLGSDSDLTQINLDDVQQIEIVQGSMGVEYGANAISGIINIITKKKSAHHWEITPFVQEETIGKEYDGIDRGRHIQSIRIAHNLSDQWHVNASFTSNDFDGFLDGHHGKNYVVNDGRRGYEWLPKQQFHAKGYLGYSPNKNNRFFYRFEYFDESTKKYDSIVNPNYDPATATYNEFSADAVFGTRRFVHLLNAAGRLGQRVNYDVYFSYQQQVRDIENFNYYIRSQQKTNVTDFDYEFRKVYYTKANFSHFLDNKYVDFQLGYEVNQIKGFASLYAGLFDGNVARQLGSYDVYGSSQINISPKFTLRPGARLLFSSKFNTQAAISLSALYHLGNGYELRGILGTCPRLPDYEELYTYFVDVNHDVQGNPGLKPEQGVSAFLHLNKIFKWGRRVAFDTKFSAWYLDINDRIELVQTGTSQQFRYINIDLYRTVGTSLTSSLSFSNWQVNGGVTFSGVSKVLDSKVAHNDNFLFGFQCNGNVGYNVPKWKALFSAYIKYNGPEYQFVEQTDANGNSGLFRGKLSDFTWLDATVRKSFAKDRLELTLGARNLANITTLSTTANEGAAHEAAATSQLMGYGRSYFLKILYKFNFG